MEFYGDPDKVRQHGELAGAPAQALIRGSYKLVRYANRSELYDLLADPMEAVDVSGAKGDFVSELEGLLLPLQFAEGEELDRESVFRPEDLEALRDLGYLGHEDE